ncbi:sigma-70 family RNA polymerase sigma factor [Lacimicrobium alkaliphilum]|uniref:RNA polymerase subunit sigma-24 n=1 Tax=Lacimicrobium alkaliphilum TaxID=1526571 RepID=A0ABQ1R2A9_9ALTE|nr:sigma-70 family RNA polymerase sigma factor [Lacimicrobium alkaliphilum]GGD54788.1 hypothetical protein GCM10011357_08130 [Lacimicrobium alkaliphilum]
MQQSFNQYLNQLYRQHSRHVMATLIRLLGDFQLAEEAMQEAFAATMQQWPEQGTPDNPKAWLIRAGRNKGIDAIRRRQYAKDYAKRQPEHTYEQELDENAVADDMLRLIFTCCHPGLSRDAQLALTLREVCGLTTEQLSSGLLVPAETVAQRIVRAKRKIKTAGIAYAKLGLGDAFQRGRDASASLGMVPAHSGSGGKVTEGKITRRGDAYVRSMAINGARSVVSRARDKTDPLSLWIQNLLKTKSFNTTVVAVANKLIRMALAMLKTGQDYRPPVALAA